MDNVDNLDLDHVVDANEKVVDNHIADVRNMVVEKSEFAL